jgi:hypothetical protein
MSLIFSLLGGLSMRVWLIIAALIAFAAWSVHVYGIGYAVADNMWKAKALEAKVASLELKLKVQKDADVAEGELRAELQRENEQQKKVIDAYLEELKTRPDKCLLGPDAERLQ